MSQRGGPFERTTSLESNLLGDLQNDSVEDDEIKRIEAELMGLVATPSQVPTQNVPPQPNLPIKTSAAPFNPNNRSVPSATTPFNKIHMGVNQASNNANPSNSIGNTSSANSIGLGGLPIKSTTPNNPAPGNANVRQVMHSGVLQNANTGTTTTTPNPAAISAAQAKANAPGTATNLVLFLKYLEATKDRFGDKGKLISEYNSQLQTNKITHDNYLRLITNLLGRDMTIKIFRQVSQMRATATANAAASASATTGSTVPSTTTTTGTSGISATALAAMKAQQAAAAGGQPKAATLTPQQASYAQAIQNKLTKMNDGTTMMTPNNANAFANAKGLAVGAPKQPIPMTVNLPPSSANQPPTKKSKPNPLPNAALTGSKPGLPGSVPQTALNTSQNSVKGKVAGKDETEKAPEKESIKDLTDVTKLAGVDIKREGALGSEEDDKDDHGAQWEEDVEPIFVGMTGIKRKMQEIASKRGITQISPDVYQFTCYALQEYLRSTLEHLSRTSKLRLDPLKQDLPATITGDVKQQLKMIEQRQKIAESQNTDGSKMDIENWGGNKTASEQLKQRTSTNSAALQAIGDTKMKPIPPQPPIFTQVHLHRLQELQQLQKGGKLLNPNDAKELQTLRIQLSKLQMYQKQQQMSNMKRITLKDVMFSERAIDSEYLSRFEAKIALKKKRRLLSTTTNTATTLSTGAVAATTGGGATTPASSLTGASVGLTPSNAAAMAAASIARSSAAAAALASARLAANNSMDTQ